MPDLIQKIAPKLFRSRYIGPPTSGKWFKYDLVIDLLGVTYGCSVEGSPGTWQAVPLTGPPGVPTLTAAAPPTTDAPAQVFTLTGLNLDQVTQVTVQDDATPPSYYSVPFLVVTVQEIHVNAGAVQTLIDNGSVVPFSFRFRIWDAVAARDFSDYIPVTAPPIIDPMADALFTAFDGGPGQIVVDVALGIAGYHLAVLENLPGYIQSVYVPNAPPTNQWTSAVFFRRRDADGGMITFANVQAPAWNLDYYNGALDTVSAALTGNFPVEMLPMWLPPDDYNWHMAVFVHDWLAGSKTLYLDGALAVQDVLGSPNTLTECYAYAGTMPPVGAACQGAPIFWRRALDGVEVAAIWATTSFPA